MPRAVIVHPSCFGFVGALFIDGAGTVIIHNSTFKNNTSYQDGGMAVVYNATPLVSKGNNTAARYGGTVAAFQTSGITLEETEFNNDRANFDGGAVYLYESRLTTSDCDILYCVADRMGGAIATNMSSSVKLVHSWFASNSAGTSGGVVSAKLNSIVLINNSTLLCNKACGGGGVAYVEYKSTVTLNNSRFINNSATGKEESYSCKNKALYWSIIQPFTTCLLYTSPSPRDATLSRMPSSA